MGGPSRWMYTHTNKQEMRGEITTNATEITVTREYCEDTCLQLGNTEETDKFLDTYNLTKTEIKKAQRI